ncbi:MAG: hypothetical protein NZ777_18230 [Pseudomonadales bacterium]|nr:hypothetical protein [Pseudomonadales bacterium]
MTFTWAAPSTDGGSAVLDYKVLWDQGTGNFQELSGATALTSTTHTQVTGITTGTTY